MSSRKNTLKVALAVGVVGLLGARVQAQAGLPTGVPVGNTGFCSYPGVEYAPRWSMAEPGAEDPATSNWGQPAADEEECATMCGNQEGCTGTTFITTNAGNGKAACYFKNWTGAAAVPCDPEAGDKYTALVKGDCDTIVFKASDQMLCADEKILPKSSTADVPEPAGGTTAPAPTGTGTGAMPIVPADGLDMSALGYWTYKNLDYVPLGTADDYEITHIAAATLEQCLEACDMSETPCNLVSWYDPQTYSGPPYEFPCYLKYVAGCTPPPTAQTFMDSRYLFVKGGDECPMPEGFDGAVAVAPAPASEDDEEAEAEPPTGTVTTDQQPQLATTADAVPLAQQPAIPNGAGSMVHRTLLAVAGAAAFAACLA